MRPRSDLRYVVAAVMAALILASTSLWSPPRAPARTQSITTITTSITLGRGLNKSFIPPLTRAPPTPHAPPNVSRGYMTPSPAARYPRFTFLANLIRELGDALNAVAAAFLALLNAIARLFSISPPGASGLSASSRGGVVNPYALALASVVGAGVAAAMLRAVLLRRRRFSPALKRPASRYGGGGEDLAGRLAGGGRGRAADPLIELVRVLARRAGEELRVNSDALTHRDLMRVCGELRSISGAASPPEIAGLLRAYELRRFAGVGVDESWVVKARGILRRLGGAP